MSSIGASCDQDGHSDRKGRKVVVVVAMSADRSLVMVTGVSGG